MSTIDKFRLLFFGSDKFSIRILDHLLEVKLCPIQVITKPHSLLDTFANKQQLVRHRWPLESSIIQNEALNIGLVASFGNLIDAKIVEGFHYGLFNIHPSLLPQYRGSTPIQTAILDGLSETGCTIMQIPPVAKFDVGKILLQQKHAIQPHEYAINLRDKLAVLGAELTVKFMLNYDDLILKAREQGEQGRCYAKKLKPEQGRLNFKSENSDLIDRKVRAYTGFIDTYTSCLNGLRVRLEDMIDPVEVRKYDLNKLVLRFFRDKGVISGDTNERTVDLPAGTMYFHKIRHLLCIKCADNEWLAFRGATPDSKPTMTAADFYNGYLSKVNPLKRLTDN